MGTTQIIEAALKVFKECHVKSFPIDCMALLEHYGYRIFTYDNLYQKNKELYDLCTAISEDAFRDGINKIIAYNSHNPNGRIRFSLMHELGHHIMGHSGESDLNEQEANAFASHILAPRMAIHYSKCKDSEDVSKVFEISNDAAAIAFDDYRRWHKHVIQYKMTYVDKGMYVQFYDSDQDAFVWSIKECDFCGTMLYNSHSSHCTHCTVPEHVAVHRYSYELPAHNIDMNLFRKLENQWLYGGL